MYNVLFSWEAQADLNDIMDDYDQQKYKGGLEFFAKLDIVLLLLEKNPFIFATKIRHFRRTFINNAPYVLYYHILEAEKDVEIIAIIHNKRGMDFIRRKLDLK